MMIIKSDSDIRLMRKAGAIAAGALQAAGEAARPGISTKELDRIVESYIRGTGCKAFFPGLWRISRQRLHLGERGGDPWDPLFGYDPERRGYREHRCGSLHQRISR